MKPWYADDLLWKVMGFGFAVFVFPAVCILLARDIVRRLQRLLVRRRQRRAAVSERVPQPFSLHAEQQQGQQDNGE